MPTYNLPSQTDINFSEGADQIFVYINSQVPMFTPIVLLCLFLVVMLGGYFSQTRTRGFARIEMWAAIAGWITGGAAIMMTLSDGLINPLTLSITIAISIITSLWYITSRE